MNTFRPARIDEYIDWLRGHLARGGRITHAYDYPFTRRRFLVAQADFSTGGECGSDAAHIVVPEGVRHSGGDLGHNSLYFMDGFTERGFGWIPVYADAEFDALPGVREARDRDTAEHADYEERIRLREARRAERARFSNVSAHQPQASTGHVVHADEPVTVNVEDDGTVILLPRNMPTRLTADEAETLAYRLLAAAKRDR